MNVKAKISGIVADLVLLAGLSGVTFGVWQIYQPGAWIVGGACAVVMARGLGAR